MPLSSASATPMMLKKARPTASAMTKTGLGMIRCANRSSGVATRVSARMMIGYCSVLHPEKWATVEQDVAQRAAAEGGKKRDHVDADEVHVFALRLGETPDRAREHRDHLNDEDDSFAVIHGRCAGRSSTTRAPLPPSAGRA